MSNIIEVKVPDIGDFSEVEIIELLIAAGDSIKAEQSLITVESDKASMEIPSPSAGVVKSLKVKVGDKVKEGSVILELEAAQTEASTKPEAAAAPAPASWACSPSATCSPASSPASAIRPPRWLKR